MIFDSVTEAQEYLTELKNAYKDVFIGKSYTISVGGNTRTFTRQDMKSLREEIQFISSEIAKMQSGNRGLNVKFGTPYDC